MIFGIGEEDFFNRNYVKIIDGIAGAGKSTAIENYLEQHNKSFVMASFSNALKFAAEDKFGCNVDTICGLCFVNTPYPRTAEKEVTEYNTVVLDEVLLDGIDCINWIRHNVGKVNIIALTDSHQMLSVENSGNVISAFDKLCKLKSTIYVNLTETRRARDEETKTFYNKLYGVESNQLFNLKGATDLLECDVINFDDIIFDPANTYICHSNKIEHEVYKRYDISSNRSIALIPKNHISRKRNVDMSKYPICDQITATAKHIDSYLQAANIATPTRFQGKEVNKDNDCYFIVESDSLFTGRELYTVGTRCQNKCSIHIVVMKVEEYKDPLTIRNLKVVTTKHLNIPDHDKTFKHINKNELATIIKEYGDPDTYYASDYVTSGDNIIYATVSMSQISKIADINEDPENYTVTLKKVKGGRKTSIRSIAKKDTTMHFDYMPEVYNIMKTDINPPRIVNPKGCKKTDFDRYVDINSAHPTMLHYAPMPKAGILYTERDDNLLNFYKYNGDKLNKGALITEELANIVGDSEYVFSTEKQTGCKIGHYAYEQCFKSKEKKTKIKENFLWGILEKNYYQIEDAINNGELSMVYSKHSNNILELVACALWSALDCVILNTIKSLNIKKYVIAVDGIYYNSAKTPVLPDWCCYRIEDKMKERICGKVDGEKYSNIIYKNYENLPSEHNIKVDKQKQRRAEKKAELERIRASRT